MQKCYIAGKVTGLKESDYKAKFRKAEIAVTVLGYEPVNPVELPHDHDKTWRSYMCEALVTMLSCDALYALADWQQSRGARIEVQLAKDIDMPVIYEIVPEQRIVPERDTYFISDCHGPKL